MNRVSRKTNEDRTYWKTFWTVGSQERWLNDMARSGFRLSKKTLFKYDFIMEAGQNYVYHIGYFDSSDPALAKQTGEFLAGNGWLPFRDSRFRFGFKLYCRTAALDSRPWRAYLRFHYSQICKHCKFQAILSSLTVGMYFFTNILVVAKEGFQTDQYGLGTFGFALSSGVWAVLVFFLLRQAANMVSAKRRLRELEQACEK